MPSSLEAMDAVMEDRVVVRQGLKQAQSAKHQAVAEVGEVTQEASVEVSMLARAR